jgi:GDPmannose 4,6-dehydratase
MNTNLENKPKVALITGITGQMGHYLAELLLNNGYIVHGIKRRSSSFNTQRIDHLYQDPHQENKNFYLHYGDMSDSSNIIRLIGEIKPSVIFHLAAMSHVKVSFDIPEYTADVDAIGTLRILEAIRILKVENQIRVINIVTSEMFGKVQETPQTEKTPFYPVSPYGTAKLYSYWIAKNYRESYGMFVTNAICFNNESPQRGETFVTRKISMAVAKIHLGLQDKLYIGNINAERDWGYTKDYMEGLLLMSLHDKPDDFILATNRKMSVRRFIELAFKEINIDIAWEGQGIDEIGYNKLTGDVLIKIDPKYFRPNEVDLLLGDATKAKTELGWEPKHTVEQLIVDMVKSDIELFEKDKYLKKGGFEIYNHYE